MGIFDKLSKAVFGEQKEKDKTAKKIKDKPQELKEQVFGEKQEESSERLCPYCSQEVKDFQIAQGQAHKVNLNGQAVYFHKKPCWKKTKREVAKYGENAFR